MTYLLDVNVLLALGIVEHEFHERVVTWIKHENRIQIATCSIAELGFLRIATQLAAYSFEIREARELLQQLKSGVFFECVFVPDTLDAIHLPPWVTKPSQITDGHLQELAHANGAIFATLDERIPDAFVVPRIS